MTITISKDVMAQEIDGETVLLDLSSEQFFGLDQVSTRIWQLLNEGVRGDGLLETLLNEYEVEREVLENDLSQLLHSLSEAGLISID